VKRPEFEKGDYEGAIKGALEDEDGILLESFMNDKNTEPAVVGSTVALCFVNLTKGVLVVGNLGDSHIILAQRNASNEMPYNVVSRVESACGFALLLLRTRRNKNG